MDWFCKIVRVVGASFPGAASCVQFQAEIDSQALRQRVVRLEDPVSHLHKDVPEVSRQIYQNLKLKNSAELDFDDGFYRKFSQALAVLESQGYINGHHTPPGNNFTIGLSVVDPSYIMYLCTIKEDWKKMESLVDLVESCEIGQWLDGNRMEIDLPLPVIKAVFKIYESKGLGECSKELGSCTYKRNV